jgi:DNA polymerase-3 subunit beta
LSKRDQLPYRQKKLFDICKSLPDQSQIDFSVLDHKVSIRAGRSRFSLSTLPAAEFPKVEESQQDLGFELTQGQFKRLIERTSFAMAQQDVRYYLNGMLLELTPGMLRSVATDGHRLATCSLALEHDAANTIRAIVPHKGIQGLARLFDDSETLVQVILGSNHVRVKTGDYIFTSKLVDGKFPDYERVIPRNGNKVIVADRQELREVLHRASILSNEKYRGVRLVLTDGNLQVTANNPEQEEAEENITVNYGGDSLEVGFNVTYLMDVLDVLNNDLIQITSSDANSSALVEEYSEEGSDDSLYVVMPMRL